VGDVQGGRISATGFCCRQKAGRCSFDAPATNPIHDPQQLYQLRLHYIYISSSWQSGSDALGNTDVFLGLMHGVAESYRGLSAVGVAATDSFLGRTSGKVGSLCISLIFEHPRSLPHFCREPGLRKDRGGR